MDVSTQKKITLSVFMPFYNEEENIRQSVETAVAVLGDIPRLSAYEVIIVDDGSHDATPAMAQELIQRFPGIVRVVTHEQNIGFGGAYRSGLRSGQHDYVFFTDGDNQFDLREIVDLLEWVPSYRVVVGYRHPRADPFHRIMNARLWNMLMRSLFGLKMRDIDCAFKLFETDLVSGLDLQSKGIMISAELMIRLKRMNVEVKEVPVTHLPRLRGEAGGARLGVITGAFKELAQFYFA